MLLRFRTYSKEVYDFRGSSVFNSYLYMLCYYLFCHAPAHNLIIEFFQRQRTVRNLKSYPSGIEVHVWLQQRKVGCILHVWLTLGVVLNMKAVLINVKSFQRLETFTVFIYFQIFFPKLYQHGFFSWRTHFNTFDGTGFGRLATMTDINNL